MTEDHKKICEALIRGRGYINDNKLKLSLGPVFDHVPEVLHFFRISNTEARKILLLNQGEYSKRIVEQIIQPLIQFLDQYRDDDDLNLWKGVENFKTILEKFNQNVFNNSSVYISAAAIQRDYTTPLAIAYYEIKQTLIKELFSNSNHNFLGSEIKRKIFPQMELITNFRNSNENKSHYRVKGIVALIALLFKDINEYFPEPENSKKPVSTLTAPTIALFCTIVNSSGLMTQGDESIETFCKKVCERFNIHYKSNTRKDYINTYDLKDIKKNKNLEKVKKSILSNICESERKQIETYLNPDNKFYG